MKRRRLLAVGLTLGLSLAGCGAPMLDLPGVPVTHTRYRAAPEVGELFMGVGLLAISLPMDAIYTCVTDGDGFYFLPFSAAALTLINPLHNLFAWAQPLVRVTPDRFQGGFVGNPYAVHAEVRGFLKEHGYERAEHDNHWKIHTEWKPLEDHEGLETRLRVRVYKSRRAPHLAGVRARVEVRGNFQKGVLRHEIDARAEPIGEPGPAPEPERDYRAYEDMRYRQYVALGMDPWKARDKAECDTEERELDDEWNATKDKAARIDAAYARREAVAEEVLRQIASGAPLQALLEHLRSEFAPLPGS